MRQITSYIRAAVLVAVVLFGTYIHVQSFNYFKNLLVNKFSTPVTPVMIDDWNGPIIQLTLLLDTSNSMDGLIEQAKSQLWNIVNELSRTKQNGKTPQLQIALYEYGNSGLSVRNGYIRQVIPFTTDMDLVSKHLFDLTTNGGDEYCGQVILTSLNELKWTNSQQDLRLIYIAGNEPFTQGPVHYNQACQLANKKGVVVNTIFCGDYQEGLRTGWKDGALCSQGSYLNINHDAATVYIPTPYDDQIEQLNDQLNETYIPYGAQGAEFQANQQVQDVNAAKYSKANKVDRAIYKSSSNYKNTKWDLVDAYEKDKEVIKKVKPKDLPEPMQDKSLEELEVEIEKKLEKRSSIQEEINALSAQRRTFIEAEKKKQMNETTSDLQNSIIESVQKVAKKKGYK